MHANTPNGPTSLHQTDIDHLNRYRFPVHPTPAGVRIVRAPAPQVAFLGLPAGPLHALETGEATSLPELIGGSDAVVHARVTAVEPGRVFGPSSRPLHYAAATVEVIGLLAGDLPGDHASALTLEIPLFDGPDAIERVRAEVLHTERVLFLRNKGASAADAGMSAAEQAADAAFYRLTSFSAEVADADGVAIVPPADSDALDAFDRQLFGDVLDELRSLVR
jgi:hypothetical protein